MTAQQIDRAKLVMYEHQDRVARYMGKFIESLLVRANTHDESKFMAEELEIYASIIDEFKLHPFGTEGYNVLRKKLDTALVHHYAYNRHHPEHFETGVNGMNLVDFLEMLADWKSASLNAGGNGDLMKSISILSEKHGISPQLTQILINTAKDFGLL